jgi:ubiquinone/menaquinone biosynthesis C-methylase UbiE
MGHTFPIDRADALEDPSRYAFCSVDELLALIDLDFDDDSAEVICDLGSGTGFYTDDVAPYAETVYAVDVQEAMAEYYHDKGLPESVECVTAEVADLPFAENALDVAVSTMTFHEFADDAAITELARVLDSDGRVAIVDWSATGTGRDGPGLAERYRLDDAVALLEAHGFEITDARSRRETFTIAARR